MLRKPEDHREFIVAPRGGDRVYSSCHTLIPIVCSSGSHGEHSVLQEEGLVSREALFEEMGFAGLILSS